MAGFGDLVRKAGLLTPDRLTFALNEQKRTGFRLGQILVDHGFVEESELYAAVSRVSGYRRLDMSTAQVDLDAARRIAPEWALEHRMLPLSVDRRSRTVVVATSDPTQSALLSDAAARFDAVPAPVVATESELGRLIRHAYFSEPLDRTRGGSTVPAGPPVMAPAPKAKRDLPPFPTQPSRTAQAKAAPPAPQAPPEIPRSDVPPISRPHEDALISRPHGDALNSRPHGDALNSRPHGDALNSRPHGDALNSRPHGDALNSRPHGDALNSRPHGDALISRPHGDALNSRPHGDALISSRPHGHGDALNSRPHGDALNSRPHGDALNSRPHGDALITRSLAEPNLRSSPESAGLTPPNTTGPVPSSAELPTLDALPRLEAPSPPRGPITGTPVIPPPFKPKTGDMTLDVLAPVVEMHQYTASAIEAIFELCVARGIISREEYLARLQTHGQPKGPTYP